jgi:L-arabinose isomerase
MMVSPKNLFLKDCIAKLNKEAESVKKSKRVTFKKKTLVDSKEIIEEMIQKIGFQEQYASVKLFGVFTINSMFLKTLAIIFGPVLILFLYDIFMKKM